jgi:hypothetical protein
MNNEQPKLIIVPHLEHLHKNAIMLRKVDKVDIFMSKPKRKIEIRVNDVMLLSIEELKHIDVKIEE